MIAKAKLCKCPHDFSGRQVGEKPTTISIIFFELLNKDDKNPNFLHVDILFQDLSQHGHDFDSIFCNVFSHKAEIPNGVYSGISFP